MGLKKKNGIWPVFRYIPHFLINKSRKRHVLSSTRSSAGLRANSIALGKQSTSRSMQGYCWCKGRVDKQARLNTPHGCQQVGCPKRVYFVYVYLKLPPACSADRTLLLTKQKPQAGAKPGNARAPIRPSSSPDQPDARLGCSHHCHPCYPFAPVPPWCVRSRSTRVHTKLKFLVKQERKK